jgi:large subunit ribosomal protein L1
MPEAKILEAVKKARELAGARKFKQSFDLAINFKNMDMKKAENRIKAEITLPTAPPRLAKIGIIADALIPAARKFGDKIVLITKGELDDYARNKKAAKKLASSCGAFFAEAALMPLVGKNLGQVLAPRGLMPKPIPPTANLDPIVARASGLVRIAAKDSPSVHCRVGVEEMTDEEIAANVEAVLKAVEPILPKGRDQLRSAFVKTTMGKPVKIEM